jgi:peptidoglycan/LPS O-acetylase OafA/YrhL
MNTNYDAALKPKRGWRRASPLLLIIPYVGTLWVSSYTSIEPSLYGIPFFYWYQFLWIVISAVITILVYASERPVRPKVPDGTP